MRMKEITIKCNGRGIAEDQQGKGADGKNLEQGERKTRIASETN